MNNETFQTFLPMGNAQEARESVRKLKDSGRFIYIDRVRKNPGFLVSFPQSIEYVRRALKNAPKWSAIGEILEKRLPGYPDVGVPTATST